MILKFDECSFEHIAVTTSTMDHARNWLSQTSSLVPYLILADEQTRGRGRHERYWHSLKGNLFSSIVLPISKPLAEVSQISFVAAVALGQTFESYGLSLYSYKWPNDVLVDHKKISGILIEAERQDAQTWIILGLGVNLAHSPRDKVSYETTSLKEQGIVARPVEFLKRFFMYFQKILVQWEKEGFAVIRDLWLKKAKGLGKKIKTSNGQAFIEGIFHDIDEKGALLLQLEGNKVQRVMAGEILMQNP